LHEVLDSILDNNNADLDKSFKYESTFGKQEEHAYCSDENLSTG